MKLREVRVQNFRCLQDVTIPLGDTTVLGGANNSGKTALLDALRITLTGNRANRRTLFDEYDYHMSTHSRGLATDKPGHRHRTMVPRGRTGQMA